MTGRAGRASAAVALAAGAAAAVALAAGALAACRDGGGTTVRFWALGREGEEVAKLLRDFEAEHPELRVEVQQLPFVSAHEKLLTAFVGEATPDLAQLGNTWVPELATLGALAPLDELLAAAPTVRRESYFEGIWDANKLDNTLYGVPWYVDTRLLFYRRDLLEAGAGLTAVPQTWPAWLAAMREIKASVGQDRYAILLPLDEFEQLLALALSEGEPLLRDGDRWGNFRSAGFRRALAFYLQLFAEQLAPVATLIQASNPWHELGRGYISFLISGPWAIAELERRLAPAQQATWATAPLPGPAGPGTSTAGGSSLVVFDRSPHKEGALQLIEYLSRPAVQRQFYELTGSLPARRATWDDPRLAGDEHVRAFRSQLDRVRRAPPVPEWERIATEMRVVSERAARQVRPGATPAEIEAIVGAAVADLDARVDRILEKRRWILARQGAR